MRETGLQDLQQTYIIQKLLNFSTWNSSGLNLDIHLDGLKNNTSPDKSIILKKNLFAFLLERKKKSIN